MDYIYDGMAIHRYDYGLLDQIDPNYHTDDVIRWAVQQVNDATSNACDLRNINTNVNKFKRWKEVAYAYYTPKTKKEKLGWGLVCAAFGYAVEEYVNIQIQGNGYPHTAEFDVSTQIHYGQTIPDISISIHYTDSATGQPKTTRVAWLDITSQKSVCHIYGKKSSGWTTMPIVIELVYPPLEASQLTF